MTFHVTNATQMVPTIMNSLEIVGGKDGGIRDDKEREKIAQTLNSLQNEIEAQTSPSKYMYHELNTSVSPISDHPTNTFSLQSQ